MAIQQDLVEQIRRGNVVLSLGAGIFLRAGPPSGDKLMQERAERAEPAQHTKRRLTNQIRPLPARDRNRTRTKVRIFAASPGDVLDERNRLIHVVQHLNRGLADRLGLTLELLRWETHVAPETGRPQGVIFEQLPPEEWDIFVGVLWLRFGSETGEIDHDTNQPYRSGTEEEFKAAYRRRQEITTGWPKVMFYRCTRPPTDMLHFDAAQFTCVEQFFAEFAPTGAHPGLVQLYGQPEEFERLVRDHLEKWLWEFVEALPKVEAQPPAVPPAPTRPVTPPFPDEEKAMNLDREIQHKQRLIEKHRARLAPLEEKQAIYGIDTPPHVFTEIEEISRKIEALEREIAELEVRKESLPEKRPRRRQSRNPTVSR